MLVMDEGLLGELRARCEQAYPHETCGLLLGRDEEGRRVVTGVHPARNLDTERSRDRYVLDPADFVAADAEAGRTGRDVVGVYHSHPDHPSAPSSTDLERAQPGWSYVIVSVTGGRATSERSWVLDAGAFGEEPIRAC